MHRYGRFAAALIASVTLLSLPACDRPQATAQPPASPAQPTQPTQPAKHPAPTTLEDVCAALQPDASDDELRAVFGDGASLDEEGNLYVTAGEGYTLEPVSSQVVSDALLGFDVFEQPGTPSQWTLHGLKIGDTWAAVERVNGGPFGELDGGIDWNGGALANDPCFYSATFDAPDDAPATISSFSLRLRRDVANTTPKLPLPTPIPAASRRSFDEVCTRLREKMSPEDLRKTFGAANTRETGADTWTVYPDDPQRAFTVNFRSWDEDGAVHHEIYTVIIDNPASTWSLPNGIAMGDTAAAVEKTVGAPFPVSRQNVVTAGGPTQDKDAPGASSACSYHVTFRHDRALIDSAQVMSSDEAFRSWRPHVAGIRADWRWF